MKIITDDAIYVQRKDLEYLHDLRSLGIPRSIFVEVFGKGILTIDNSNKNDFVKFVAKEDIEFLKNLEWIVDYNELKDLTIEQLTELIEEVVNQMNGIADTINELNKEKKPGGLLHYQWNLLKAKMHSLEDII